MDNKINYNNIVKVLKAVPMNYRGADITFSHIDTEGYEASGGHKFSDVYELTNIDCHYIVSLHDLTKPFVTRELLYYLEDRIKRYAKLVYGSLKDSEKLRLNPKLTLRRKGVSDVQIPPAGKPHHYESEVDIMIGTKNEEILESFSGQGMVRSNTYRLEYWIENYGKGLHRAKHNGVSQNSWSYVEDNKLCLLIDVNVSVFEFMLTTNTTELSDEITQEIIQDIKTIKSLDNKDVNKTYEMIESLYTDLGKRDLSSLVPTNTPLKIKNPSDTTKQLMEILIYFCGDEWVELDYVLPGLSDVVTDMNDVLQDLDDMYVRLQTNLLFDGVYIQNRINYYPDSIIEAEDSLLNSLLVDYIYENL